MKPAALSAFSYLRQQAVNAHLAGDAVQVIHLCTTALERVRKMPVRPQLASVRWAFFLGLPWLLDDWFLDTASAALTDLLATDLAQSDSALIEYVLAGLRHPLQVIGTDQVASVAKEWVEGRSIEIEDVTAMTFAIDLCWYQQPDGDAWKQLAETWCSRALPNSPLETELTQRIARLQVQTSFCEGISPPHVAGSCGTTDELRLLVEGWGLFYACRFDELGVLLRQIAVLIRTDSPHYSRFFSLIHFSRIQRKSKESRDVSLARRQFVTSRQPAEIAVQLRNERFERHYGVIARSGFSDWPANERHACFRLAMLNQLHALRTWDIGGWLAGVRQLATSCLELGARGDLAFARQGIMAAVRALLTPERGKFPHTDASLSLLDHLPTEQREELVRKLTTSHPIEWRGAHAVLSELADAIPPTMHAAVAEWSTKLETHKYYRTLRLSYLGFWEDILKWAPDPATVIEILRPAILDKAGHPMSWHELHGTIVAAIVRGNPATASDVLSRVVETEWSEVDAMNEQRVSILYNVARWRPEFADRCTAWMADFAASRDDKYWLYLVAKLRHEPTADAEVALRDWLRDSVLAFCQERLQETQEFSVGGWPVFHQIMREIEWPKPERHLVERLVQVVEATHVPLVAKTECVACLAELVATGPLAQARRIARIAVKWLDAGVQGRSLDVFGPLSTVAIRGFGPQGTVHAVWYLFEKIATKCPEAVAKQLSDSMLLCAWRSLSHTADAVIATALLLSRHFAGKDNKLSVALVGIAGAVAQYGMQNHPRRVLQGFRHVLFDEPGNPKDLRAWLRGSAGLLCLAHLAERLGEAAKLVTVSARETAAATLYTWKNCADDWPDHLAGVLEALSHDCRLRVQAAARGSWDDVEKRNRM